MALWTFRKIHQSDKGFWAIHYKSFTRSRVNNYSADFAAISDYSFLQAQKARHKNLQRCVNAHFLGLLISTDRKIHPSQIPRKGVNAHFLGLLISTTRHCNLLFGSTGGVNAHFLGLLISTRLAKEGLNVEAYVSMPTFLGYSFLHGRERRIVQL